MKAIPVPSSIQIFLRISQQIMYGTRGSQLPSGLFLEWHVPHFVAFQSEIRLWSANKFYTEFIPGGLICDNRMLVSVIALFGRCLIMEQGTVGIEWVICFYSNCVRIVLHTENTAKAFG